MRLPRAIRQKIQRAVAVAEARLQYGRQDEHAMKLEQLIVELFDSLCEEGLMP